MNLITPKFEIVQKPEDLRLIERAARICYKSKVNSQNLDGFLKKLRDMGHETPFEHLILSVQVVTSRSVSHQLVRHRLASFNQESQRYVDYNKTEEIQFIRPIWAMRESFKNENDEMAVELFELSCKSSESAYKRLRSLGKKPEEARAVLPESCATRLLISANFREWIHIFNLRALSLTGKADAEMLRLMIPIYKKVQSIYPAAMFPYVKEFSMDKKFFAEETKLED